jgi:predicted DNA-binding transcriptional regulator AlpA
MPVPKGGIRLADPDIKFVSPRRASELTSLSTRQLARLADADQFPQPLRLGIGRNGRLAFVESEVQAWLRARLAERKVA